MKKKMLYIKCVKEKGNIENVHFHKGIAAFHRFNFVYSLLKKNKKQKTKNSKTTAEFALQHFESR